MASASTIQSLFFEPECVCVQCEGGVPAEQFQGQFFCGYVCMYVS